MDTYILFILSFFFTFSFMVMYFVTPLIIQVVKVKRLFEKVSDRSSHAAPVPSFGGVTFFIIFILSLSYAEQFFPSGRAYFLVPASLIIFFTGLKDDLTGTTPWNKISMQLFATTILFFSPDFQITNLHGFLGIHEISPWFCIPLSYLVIIFYINAYNLIDGIDGLASSLGSLFFTFYCIVYFTLGDYMMMAVCLAMVAAFIAFLRYNLSKTKRIFLGDTGSLLIGFLIAAIVLNILSKDYQEQIHIRYISNLPLLIISALYLPVFDSIRVFIIRLQQGRSPFSADRFHIHHVLLDYFHLTHRQTTLILVSLNAVVLIIMGIAAEFFEHKTSVLILLSITALLAWTLRKFGRALQTNTSKTS